MTLSRDDLAKLFGIDPKSIPAAMLTPEVPTPKAVMFPATDAEMDMANEIIDDAKELASGLAEVMGQHDEPLWDKNGNDIEFAEDGVDAPARVVVSPTALQLDMWDVNRGVDCLAASKTIQDAYPGLRMDLLTEERKNAELVMADMHGVAYLMDPQPVECCTDPRRLEFVKQLLETPECQVLRKSTVLNDLAAEMAATQFGMQYVELVKADAEREKKNQAAGRRGPSPEKQEIQKESGLRRAVSKALSAAKDEVDSLDDVARGLGGDGSLGNTPQEAKKIAEAYKKIRNNKDLKEIFNRAGAFRRLMQSQQRRKTAHGQDDVVGVVMDGEIHRLLPVELAKLADDDYELDTLRRIAEKQAMCRQYTATERVARGPVVVCVDESGSMHGEPVWNAKAFALAMMNLAKIQNRWIALVGYAGATEGTRLIIKPGNWNPTAIMDWLSHFYGGGTECDVPLEQLPKWWSGKEMGGLPQGKTDLIIITDAIMDIPDRIKESFNTWKEEANVKSIGLVIGTGDAGDLKHVLNSVYMVKGIGLNEEGVAEALSI